MLCQIINDHKDLWMFMNAFSIKDLYKLMSQCFFLDFWQFVDFHE